MVPNFLVLVASAFIPFFIGYIWYHPNLFGGDNWKRTAELTDEKFNKAISPFKMILSVVLNLFLAFGIYNLAVHTSGVFGLVGAEVDLMNSGTAKAFLDEYGHNHRSFGHGMLHGFFPGVLSFVLPVIGYVAIFERKSTKYILVTLGFWTVSMILMGGVICKWGVTIVS